MIFQKVTVVDFQRRKSEIPDVVYNAVRDLWRERELGNDTHYVYVDAYYGVDELSVHERIIYDWMLDNDLVPEETLLHWWW
jgi:hypothetical protein